MPLATAPVGTEVPAVVTVRGPAGEARADVAIPVAEPGWTMFMVSTSTTTRCGGTPRPRTPRRGTRRPVPTRSGRRSSSPASTSSGRTSRRPAHDPDYQFVLAEIDYLKPYWDTQPEDRAVPAPALAEGRVELMGGTYNEPNTNLTSPETTIRNLVYGIGFSATCSAASPATAWQLDVFGHDPQFPGCAPTPG